MTEAAVRPPEPLVCDECGSHAGVPIAYGMPGPELVAEAEDGQVALGGCLIFAGQPDYRCSVCGHEWADEDQP